MATPPAPVTALLLILDRAEIILGPGEHCVGRSTDCAILLDDALASRRHATIVVRPEGVTVRDLGSRNGVLVNGEDIDGDRPLIEGDAVTVGAKVLTVQRIYRAGAPRPAGRQGGPIEPSTLGKIAVTRRAVPRDSDQARAAVDAELTTLNAQDGAVARPPSAFRLIAGATARCIATGREERVAMILEAPLAEVHATLRVGLSVDEEILDIVVDQALLLCEITHDQRWIDYLHDLFDLLRRPMPLAVVDRLMPIVDRER